MCYHKAVPVKNALTEYLKEYGVTVLDYQPYYHVSGFDHPHVPVMTMDQPDKVQPYMWGMVPAWAKDRRDAQDWANKMLNATCEKADSTFKPYFKSRRCLVFVSGFFEWQWKDEKGKEKVPYFIYMEDRQPFALGGIYNIWEDRESGSLFPTYAVVTTPANKLMEEIHNSKKRMPLIVPQQDWGRWFDPASPVGELLQPYPEGALKCHEISRTISQRGADTNTPQIQEPFGNTLF